MPSTREQVERRLARVLRILMLIQRQPGKWSRKQLAERYGVSERMLDKDLQLLRAIGYRIEHPLMVGGYTITAEPGIE
jgi:predicted DNA-binding transcriptional regulator YafY